ncbi:MAG TPA: M20/M25/M40 family metallo-hydrolase, partial [Baekduia sp.]|nr:M20/M25/M40 family metallo-hydrolase [Baekduia sp.]
MADDLQDAAVGLLQRLLRCRTVNPPGAERAANELLAAELESAGFDDVRLVGATHDRPNLVARLRGRADGPTLCLLSHVDTVLADPEDWRHDPWSGDVLEGDVWGRGAQDMKSQTAAEVTAACALARSGWRPARGDLLVVAVADEETGGELGAIWLCENHPELVRCDMLLNEGGGTVIPHGDELLVGVCVAEKGVARFTLTVHGVAGHASMPAFADNALPKLAPLITRLAEAAPEQDLTEAPLAL